MTEEEKFLFLPIVMAQNKGEEHRYSCLFHKNLVFRFLLSFALANLHKVDCGGKVGDM